MRLVRHVRPDGEDTMTIHIGSFPPTSETMSLTAWSWALANATTIKVEDEKPAYPGPVTS